MKRTLPSFLAPLFFVLFAFFFFGGNTNKALASETAVAQREIMVSVITMERYVIEKPGDNLTWLAGRFGVSREAILKANPHIALRTNPEKLYWLYLGEEVTIPVFVASKEKPLTSVGTDDFVALPAKVVQEQVAAVKTLSAELEQVKQKMATIERDAAVAKTNADNLANENAALKKNAETLVTEKKKIQETNQMLKDKNTSTEWALVALVLGLIAAFLIIPFFFQKKPNKTENASVKKSSPEQVKTEPKAEDLLVAAQNLSGEEIARFLGMTCARDECNNPVIVRNAFEFMQKRAELGLSEMPLGKWQEAINKKAKTPQTPAAA